MPGLLRLLRHDHARPGTPDGGRGHDPASGVGRLHRGLPGIRGGVRPARAAPRALPPLCRGVPAMRECVQGLALMSDIDKPGATELKDLMRRVLDSNAGEAFESFMVRQMALRNIAPGAGDAVVEGIEESPDGGAAMAEEEREALLDRASMEAGRRLHSAALALLGAVGAARLPIEVTPEMVAVAAITELGDSLPGRASDI